MSRSIFIVTTVNIAALLFCIAALYLLVDSPILTAKAILMAQVPMLLATLAGLAAIQADWVQSRQRRRVHFISPPLQEQVRHASWLATFPVITRQV